MSKNGKLFNKKGIDYRVTSAFGMRNIPSLGMYNNYHIGVDYAYPQGTELVSPLPGEVLLARTGGDYGGQVFLYVPQLNRTMHYAHVSRLNVKTGDKVSVGQVIGLSGGARGTVGAGTSTGPHLHLGSARGKFTRLDKGKMGDGLWVNPETLNFAPKKSDAVIAQEIIDGKWGNNPKRKADLTAAGYDYDKVQGMANTLLKGDSKPSTGFTLASIVAIKSTATKYATGENIAPSVIGKPYGLKQLEPDKALLKDIMSWVYLKDLEVYKTSPQAPNKPTQPVYKNAHGQSVRVGDKIQFSVLYTQEKGGKAAYPASLYYKEKRGNATVGYGYVQSITGAGYRVTGKKGGSTIGFVRAVNVY